MATWINISKNSANRQEPIDSCTLVQRREDRSFLYINYFHILRSRLGDHETHVYTTHSSDLPITSDTDPLLSLNAEITVREG